MNWWEEISGTNFKKWEEPLSRSVYLFPIICQYPCSFIQVFSKIKILSTCLLVPSLQFLWVPYVLIQRVLRLTNLQWVFNRLFRFLGENLGNIEFVSNLLVFLKFSGSCTLHSVQTRATFLHQRVCVFPLEPILWTFGALVQFHPMFHGRWLTSIQPLSLLVSKMTMSNYRSVFLYGCEVERKIVAAGTIKLFVWWLGEKLIRASTSDSRLYLTFSQNIPGFVFVPLSLFQLPSKRGVSHVEKSLDNPGKLRGVQENLCKSWKTYLLYFHCLKGALDFSSKLVSLCFLGFPPF